MKFSLYSVLLLLLLYSCKFHQSKESNAVEANVENTAEELFPINDLIRGDIRKIKEQSGGLQMVDAITHEYRFIQLAELDSFCSFFIAPELEQDRLNGSYLSNSLVDATTSQLNIIYTAKDPLNPFKKMVLYVVPGNVNSKVSSIYVEKEYIKGDTLVEERLQWKMGNYCSRAIKREWGDGKSTSMQFKLIWEPQLFENLQQ